MLVRRQALGSVDRQGVPEAKQKPPGLSVGKAAPFDVRELAVLGPDTHAGAALREHRNHVAVVADLLLATIDHSPCPPEQAHPIAFGQRQVIFRAPLVDSRMDLLGT